MAGRLALSFHYATYNWHMGQDRASSEYTVPNFQAMVQRVLDHTWN